MLIAISSSKNGTEVLCAYRVAQSPSAFFLLTPKQMRSSALRSMAGRMILA
jgi:hypothetical protein